MTVLRTLILAAGSLALIAQTLPPGRIPPGKVLLVIQPHHDDHISQGGLIARFVDEGYEGYYIRVSNDEKDGSASYPINDMINLRESVAATKILGLKDVISLNWRSTDYGKGHQPNVVIELTGAQVRRRAAAHQTHRNVFARPSNARAARKNLAANKLVIPELDGLDDQAAAVRLQEWQVEWDARKVGQRHGVSYAEVHWFVDEFDYLPGLKEYIAGNAVKR
jgi:hypothetical protein